MKQFWIVTLILGGASTLAWATLRTESATGARPEEKARAPLKAVFHINFADPDRQRHGLKNAANALKLDGKAEIEVVCHGAGIGLLVNGQSQATAEVQKLMQAGVRFRACENTMREKGIAKENLLAGVATVPAGAVEVIRKQQEGFGYFKP